MPASAKQITFPPETVASGPVRLPIVLDAPDWLAIAKPPGVPVSDGVVDGCCGIASAVKQATASRAGQFARLGFVEPEMVTDLEVDASGVVVLAKTHQAATRLRNQLGSNAFSFRYVLIAEGPPADASEVGSRLECRLPLAWDDEKGRTFVSQRLGKKCTTSFSMLAKTIGYSAWVAETHFPRADQIRAHAREVGLRMVGDRAYTRVKTLSLASLKGIRRRRDDDEPRPVNEGLCLHLSTVQLNLAEGRMLEIKAPFSKSMRTALSLIGADAALLNGATGERGI